MNSNIVVELNHVAKHVANLLFMQAWVCDADPDCPDGEDESAAICEGVTNCHHDQFRCERSGECIDYGEGYQYH